MKSTKDKISVSVAVINYYFVVRLVFSVQGEISVQGLQLKVKF
jgi:hypothetical protein